MKIPVSTPTGRGRQSGNPNVLVVFLAVMAIFVVLVVYVWLKDPAAGTLLAQLPPAAERVGATDAEQGNKQVKTNPAGEALLEEVLDKPLNTQEQEGKDSTQKPADQQLVPAAPKDSGQANTSIPTDAKDAATPLAATGADYSYTVKAGETLFAIASKFKNPAAMLREANSLKDDNVQQGQVIKIKIQAVHKVASGQSLGMLARKYHVGMADIRKANGLASDQINIDQDLIIPVL